MALSIAWRQPVGGEVNVPVGLCAGIEVVGSNQLLVAQGGGEVRRTVALARPAGGGDSRGEISLQGGIQWNVSMSVDDRLTAELRRAAQEAWHMLGRAAVRRGPRTSNHH